MDLPTLKLLAARVRALLEQSHHHIGHNQSLDLIAALPGLRNWPEVKAFPDRVAACQLDDVSAARLGTQLKKRFGLSSSTTPPFLVILDEYAFYADAPDDRLKETLRTVEGVPMVSYLVHDGQVFVFEKLVQDLKALSVESLGDRLPELATHLELLCRFEMCSQCGENMHADHLQILKALQSRCVMEQPGSSLGS